MGGQNPRREIAPLPGDRHLDVCKAQQCGGHVDVARGDVEALSGGDVPGPAEDPGHVEFFAVQAAPVSLQPVLPEGLAVVGGEGQHGAVGELQGLQRFIQGSQLPIVVMNLGLVALGVLDVFGRAEEAHGLQVLGLRSVGLVGIERMHVHEQALVRVLFQQALQRLGDGRRGQGRGQVRGPIGGGLPGDIEALVEP